PGPEPSVRLLSVGCWSSTRLNSRYSGQKQGARDKKSPILKESAPSSLNFPKTTSGQNEPPRLTRGGQSPDEILQNEKTTQPPIYPAGGIYYRDHYFC